MNDRNYKWVFGPVPSRRLGRSLGIDLVPFKTCSYDCVYCQLGRTTVKTIERREFTPLAEVLEEIDRKLAEGSRPDYITLSGSGEPTLHTGISELVPAVKKMTDIPLAVLTNGSLLWDPDVREALQEADLVVPSLDAGDAEAFQRVNRPHRDIPFETMLEGLVQFRSGFTGQLWLEVFLVGKVTGCDSQVRKIATLVERIRPDRIQLNTVIRPPAEQATSAVRKARLLRFAKMFGERAEIIADFDQVFEHEDFEGSRESVSNLLRRRPCSLEGVVQGLGVHPNEALKFLDDLLKDGTVTTLSRNGTIFYVVNAIKT